MRTVKIEYYALFREQAGLNEEQLDTHAATVQELYQELRQRHGFSLSKEQLRVAVNAEFGDWDTPISNGDAIVFIPPVAGG